MMDTKIYGPLHSVYENERIIAIKSKNKVDFYYMSKGMFRNFMMYFQAGIYIFIEVQKTPHVYKGFLVRNVINIEKIIAPHKNEPKIYYDVSVIKSGIKSIVNEKNHRLFIDFEMSMPPYQNYENFISEIIQVGYILTDENGKIVEKFGSYVKPELFPKISIRTVKFLNVNQDMIETGITYKKLYEKLKYIQNRYHPAVYVWGKNDQLELNKLNRIHKLSNFVRRTRFIDLLNLHKIYFGLKNDLGLFNAYNYYSQKELDNQKHDALEDATITMEVFNAFVKVCNNKLTIDFEKK